MLVGHGPAPDFGPYVPDLLVVRDEEGARRVFSRDGPVELFEGKLPVSECEPEPVQKGCWPLVFRDQDVDLPLRFEWFPLSDEKKWRIVRAQSLLLSAKSLRGNPELSLRTVRAAAALVAVDIEKVARDLSVLSFSGESLVETLERRGGKA